MADSTFHDDIRDIRTMVTDLVAGQARTEQKIDGLDKRLYDGGAGAIPVLYSKYNALDKEVVEAKSGLSNAIVAVNNRVDNQRAWVAGVAATITVFLGGVKYALGKYIHIP